MPYQLEASPDEIRQVAFDARLEEIRAEGAQAFRDGLTRDDCPYDGHPEPHYRASWIGGMAEAALGLDGDASPSP